MKVQPCVPGNTEVIDALIEAELRPIPCTLTASVFWTPRFSTLIFQRFVIS